MGQGETNGSPAGERPAGGGPLHFDRLVAMLSPELQRALSNPLRRRILRVLSKSEEPLTPHQLVAAVGREGLSRVHFHLTVLEQSGSVRKREQEGSWTFASTVDGNPQVTAVLRATARSDRGLE